MNRFSWGAAKTPDTPKDVSVGPTPRNRTDLDPELPTTNPAIMILGPVPTLPRTDRFMSREVGAMSLLSPESVTGIVEPDGVKDSVMLWPLTVRLRVEPESVVAVSCPDRLIVPVAASAEVGVTKTVRV